MTGPLVSSGMSAHAARRLVDQSVLGLDPDDLLAHVR